ncbi:hypothetical protein P7C73_g1165, partial [Tremellales sp. Uapishka_1]
MSIMKSEAGTNVVESKVDFQNDALTIDPTSASDPNLDVAGKFLAEVALSEDAAELLAPYTQAEERAVARKADMIIVPLLLVALMMGAVDKNALGTAAVLGLRKDLHLVGQQYSWTGSIIFFGSLCSVFPALFIMQRFPTGKIIAANVFIWGIIAMCIAACKNFAGIAVCRFILGLFEALTFPGFSLVISSWYTRREQIPLVNCVKSGRLISPNAVGGSLGSLFIIYFYWAPYVVITSVVIANTGGYTKKTVVYGVAYCGYLVGNIVGPQTFRAAQAPTYTGGIVAMLVCYCIAILLIFVYYLNILRLNKKKERYLTDHPEKAATHGLLGEWSDETDFQSAHFRYVI